MGCHSGKNKSKQGGAMASNASSHKLNLGKKKAAPKVNLSDKEAGQFAKAALNAQKVQMKARKKMVGIIKNNGLDIKTFQKIAQAKRKGKSAKASGVSNSDMKKYKKASKAMQKAQQGIRKKVKKAVEKTGMKMQRFRQISRAARSDTALQQQIRKKIQQMHKSGSASQQPSAQ